MLLLLYHTSSVCKHINIFNMVLLELLIIYSQKWALHRSLWRRTLIWSDTTHSKLRATLHSANGEVCKHHEIQKQPPEEVFLTMSQNSQGKICLGVSFLIKLQAYLFLQNISWRQLLKTDLDYYCTSKASNI